MTAFKCRSEDIDGATSYSNMVRVSELICHTVYFSYMKVIRNNFCFNERQHGRRISEKYGTPTLYRKARSLEMNPVVFETNTIVVVLLDHVLGEALFLRSPTVVIFRFTYPLFENLKRFFQSFE